MKEYLNIILGSMIGVIVTVAWGLITTYFRSKQNAKDNADTKKELSKNIEDNKEGLSKVNLEMTLMKEQIGDMKTDIAVTKENVSTIKDQTKTIIELVQKLIVSNK